MSRVVLRFLWGLVLVVLVLSLVLKSLNSTFSYPTIWPEKWDLGVWMNHFDGEAWMSSVLLSLLMSCSVAIVSTVSAFVMRYLWSTKVKEWSIPLWPFYLPYLISPIVLAIGLQVFMLRLGWSGTLFAIIIGQLCIAYPYAVILQDEIWGGKMRMGLEMAQNFNIPMRSQFQRVVLPYALPLIRLSLIQTFLISWFDFAMAQIIGVGKVPTLTILLYNSVLEADMRLASLAALLILLPIIVLISLLSRWRAKTYNYA